MDEMLWQDAISLGSVRSLFKTHGCVSGFFKLLVPNNNSKNQIYLGLDLSAVSVIPSGEVLQYPGKSNKPGADSQPIYHASLDWTWLSPEGASPAPSAQLIYYPQYPEVRFSGFLRGSTGAPNEFMNPVRRGKEPGRILFIGVDAARKKAYGVVVSAHSPAAAEIRAATQEDHDVLVPFRIGAQEPALQGRELLLAEFGRIHRLGWVASSQLQPGGSFGPCTGNRCGGHTLEAHLGITANGYADPDFAGWEVKQYNVAAWHRAAGKPVTLFTPQPDRGRYAEHDTTWFVHQYGRQTRADRYDFTGRHIVGQGPNSTTGLRLELYGYDPHATKAKDRITTDGAINLIDAQGEVAAGWSFAKLLEHWKRKHAQAAYLPSMSRTDPLNGNQFSFGAQTHLGEGTSFLLFLEAMAAGHISYDPGCHTTLLGNGRWQAKPRNQIRIKHNQLSSIYDSYETVELL